MSVLLGINIDHVATLRQARGTRYPDPVQAALIAEQAGADGITVHLREDRRHIQDRDVELLAHTLQTRMNLEMAATEEMVGIARRIGPAHSCLVPEKREELTTEGGLDVVANEDWIRDCCARLADAGIEVSLFIGADPNSDWVHDCVETDDKNFVVTGRGARSLETSTPGVFAIGDVRAGSTKRVAAAVGEGAAVVAQIHAMLAERSARETA